MENLKYFAKNRIAGKISALPAGIKYVFLLFFFTRILLGAIGVVSRLILNRPEYVWNYSDCLFLDIWGVWDSGWYLSIIANGYPDIPVADIQGPSNYGFLPLYPLVVKLVSMVVGNNYVSTLIVSNLCLFTACYFLYKLVRLESSEKTALRSIKYLFFFPSAFILSGAFSEAMFLMLIVAGFYYAKKEKWLIAGACGYFLSLTRSIGVVVLIPFLYEYLRKIKWRIGKIRIDIIFLVLVPLGFLSFCIYCYFQGDDFFAYIHAKEKGWGQVPTNPYKLIIGGLLSDNISISFNVVSFLILATILIIFIKKLDFSYWMVGFMLIVIPLTTGATAYTGVWRFSVVAFPYFILLANLAKTKNFDRVLTIVLALLQAFFMILWSNGYGAII